jgi:hypothetical protein
MDCSQVQAAILDACDSAASVPPLVDTHLAGCRECAQFAERQRTVDARLTAALRSPALSPSFRTDLRKALRREPSASWSDRVPDIVHFASCGIATVCCAVLLPFDAASTVAAGTIAALTTYMLMATVRSSFEDIEQP